MDHKTLATILFRVFGISYFLYGVFYAPYFFVTATFSDTLIISSLAILSYFGAGFGLFFLSGPLGALVVKGLDRNRVPPPPPRFENS